MAEADMRLLWQAVNAHIHSQKKQLLQSILHYPPPITACDQQFDHLLQERERITAELNRLEALKKESLEQEKALDHGESIRLLETFLDDSPYVDMAVSRKILAGLSRSLPGQKASPEQPT